MGKNNKTENRYLVPSVDQASRILFCLAGSKSSHMSLTEICTKVSIHKSKAFSLLHTLHQFNLIQRNVDGKGYSLGPSLITLSRKVLDNLSAPRLADPILEELARKTKSTAILGLIADQHVFVAAKQEGESDIGVTIRIGHRFPLTYGSHGKVIAAFLQPEEFDQLLQDHDLYFHGNPERFDRARLQKELVKCRRDGFALELGEMMKGINTVAAPVIGIDGAPIGYLVVIGVFTAKDARQFGPLVAKAGKALSQQLGAEV